MTVADDAAAIKPGPAALTDRLRTSQFREHNFGNRRCFVNDDHADRVTVIAAEREVGDVHAMPAEDCADLADDARLSLFDMTIIVPSSGASTAMPSTVHETR